MSEEVKGSASPALPVNGKVGTAKLFYDWGQQLYHWYRQRTRWTVTIDSNDKLYDIAHRWFIGASGGENLQSVNARLSARTGAFVELESSDSPHRDEPAVISLYYDGSRERRVDIDGHKVTVQLDRGSVRTDERSYSPDVLNFHAHDHAGQLAVLSLLRRLAADSGKREPVVQLLNRWGGWESHEDLPPRRPDSVFLPPGQWERIHNDIRRFLDSESEYIRRSVPWHRGYFLYGPPGTGKTSVARALSTALGLDLWYAPLGDIRGDTDLLNLISRVTPRSILLLEDFDRYEATHGDAEEAEKRLTIGGILNALDGVGTPHGLITILTANNRDAIDPALLRPGRVDVTEEFTTATPSTVTRMFRWWYDTTDTPPSLRRRFSSAEAIEIFKRHDDPAAAAQELGR